MEYHYSAERNVQMTLFLLKAFGIKKVIASPGATNISIVASMQQDTYFEIYSCVDERSAAYMAVGLADESGEPIVLSCTGATSARNYMPALTEAYYRKLPIIAITSTQDQTHIGHLIAQVTDRSQQPRDLVIESVYIQNIRSQKDEWDCNLKLNKALQAFKRTPGPVHINLATGMGGGYGVTELPPTKIIKRYNNYDRLPSLNVNGHVAIFVGSHPIFSEKLTNLIDAFCASYDAVVFCDHTSSYKGKYRVMYSLIGAQDSCKYEISKIDTLIHIGEISGDYDTLRYLLVDKVWRVCEDGAFRDTFFGHLDSVFDMTLEDFFCSYINESYTPKIDYYVSCRSVYESLLDNLKGLPLSNIYIAKTLSSIIPENSVVYLGILNTLRSWNYFDVPTSVRTVSNVGGFGIDGIMSSLIGASFHNKEKLYFGIVGDLSFFYDMNCIGNRQIGNNIRLMVINNGHGQEFEMYNHAGAFLGEDVNKYVAAAGHHGNQSKDLIKHYAIDLGFEYMSANNIDEFNSCYNKFIEPISEKSIIFEVYTYNNDENEALRLSRNIEVDNSFIIKKKLEKMKSLIREIPKKILK